MISQVEMFMIALYGVLQLAVIFFYVTAVRHHWHSGIVVFWISALVSLLCYLCTVRIDPNAVKNPFLVKHPFLLLCIQVISACYSFATGFLLVLLLVFFVIDVLFRLH
ncbi:MAG: hypothetical protein JWL77_4569 [Chthonomonadaceae bacterium]|nr:hypothetical protein [Chthonomonadaceae bacterium]